jgi:hypothetical protein
MTQQKDYARDRRDIGHVVFLADKIDAARQLSGCCVGVERILEDDADTPGLLSWFSRKSK